MEVQHERPTIEPDDDDAGFNLNFFVLRDSNLDTPCVFDQKMYTLGDVWSRIHPTAFTPVYVICRQSCALMKANDAGWPARTRQQYDTRCCANTLEFILSFDANGCVNGICGFFNSNVRKGDEICATYGWEYWTES